MRLKWASLTFSLLLLVGLFYITEVEYKGFNLGIDFAGGIQIEADMPPEIGVNETRQFFGSEDIPAKVQQAGKQAGGLIEIELDSQTEVALKNAAEENAKQLSEAGVSTSPVDYLHWKMAQELTNGNLNKIQFASVNQVGPTIGDQLQNSAFKLLGVSLTLIVIYVAFRFRFNFAFGALIALVHDLALTMGLVGFFQIPLSVPVIAALLTILGYSINDTIVIFDRIRENMSAQEPVATEDIANTSINQSLSRTIVTSITTLIAVVSVYAIAGESLRDMAAVLIIGVIVGTYSSIFIASPIVVIWDQRRSQYA